MADFLDEKRREMQARLNELKPLVEEAQRLEAVLRALDGVERPPRPARAPAGRRRRRAPANGTGTRGKEALELVRSRPGITIGEIAESMGIQQNYLYRVLPGLQREGLVRKEGRGWHPMNAT